MNVHRALAEVQDLKAGFGDDFRGRLSYDFTDAPEVRIKGVQFPPGWRNQRGGRHGCVLFELSESYPEHPPHIYISEGMRFESSRPPAMSPGRLNGEAEWAPFSVFPADENWDPESHTLATAFELLMQTLRAPGTNAGDDGGADDNGNADDDVAAGSGADTGGNADAADDPADPADGSRRNTRDDNQGSTQ
jgi:hypothetical protein